MRMNFWPVQIAFAYLQQAWDRGDLAELRGLCSDKVFSELQDQIKARAAKAVLTAEGGGGIAGCRDTGAERNVAVMFDVLFTRKSGLAPSNVRKSGILSAQRPATSPTWFLDGIQQVGGLNRF